LALSKGFQSDPDWSVKAVIYTTRSRLQYSEWMSGTPVSSPFSGWNELLRCPMERQTGRRPFGRTQGRGVNPEGRRPEAHFSAETGRSGEANRRSGVLQETYYHHRENRGGRPRFLLFLKPFMRKPYAETVVCPPLRLPSHLRHPFPWVFDPLSLS